jgi:outer membrane protein assembly factor BamB
MNRYNFLTTISAVALTVAIAVCRASADDWPQFRGPNRDGVSAEKGLLQKWPDGGPPKMWTSSGLGLGDSSVAVANRTIFGTGKLGDKLSLWALDEATGKPKWSTPMSDEKDVKAVEMNSTPTFANGKVYAVSGLGDLVCADADSGRILWRKSYVNDFGGMPPGFGGYSDSVLVDEGKVICVPGSKAAAIVALKAETGEVIWKTEMTDSRPGNVYSSAVTTGVGGVPLYIALLSRGQGGLTAVHAETGTLLWQYENKLCRAYPIPMPLVKGDWVFATTDMGWAVLKMAAAGKDKVTVQELKRYGGTELGCYYGGMVLANDFIYFAHYQRPGGCPPVCVGAKSWEIKWKADQMKWLDPEGKRDLESASIIYADGMLYYQYESGLLALVRADPNRFALVSTFNLKTSRAKRSTPAIANGKLYIHDHDRLYCFNIKAEGK